MFHENTLKRGVAAGRTHLAIWLQTASPALCEIAAVAGYDVLILDNEHGPASIETTIAMMRAGAAGDPSAECLVRVPWNDPVYLKRILDAGAQSLMIPMVETPSEAAAAVAACRYPPRGTRGYSASTARASRYGVVKDYIHRAHEELFIAVQIESARAVERAADIAAVDGVDMVFIGPNDLAGSVGYLERLGEPPVDALIKRCEGAVRQAGKALGTVPRPGNPPESLFAQGYTIVGASSDSSLFRDAALAEVARLGGRPPSVG